MGFKYKVFLIITLLTLKCHLFFGQEESKFAIGINGGPSIVKWYGLNQEYYIFRTGFIGGVTAQYIIKPWFVLGININYERKGYQIDWTSFNFGDMINPQNGFTYSNNNTLKNAGFMDYVTLPVVTKFRTHKRKVKYYTSIGMYMGYLVKPGLYTMRTGKEDPNNYNRLDIGLVNGLGIEIPIKKHFQFSIEARNNLGFLNILKNSSVNSKNESFAVLFGLTYKI